MGTDMGEGTRIKTDETDKHGWGEGTRMKTDETDKHGWGE
ncbi:MAG: hypothetical protein KatS3mg055_1372 [Chloroflexus sp.]|nr:MAG: hypothetical protein KatS3mg055_1372 [Chloroflexus sp.]